MQQRIRVLSFLVLFCLLITVFAQQDNLVLGEFKVSRVVDGDTLGVEGLSNTIRFLCIDTEESEKGPGAEERTKEIAKNFTTYVLEQTRNNPNPKFNTPMGWEGTLFAKKWFPVGSTVRIEFDEPGRKIDFYGRNLGYVFVKKNGKWINYNVECVRAGMSPYLDKYGPSKRFESEFLDAEREARIYKRGIWNPQAMAYPNYDNRLAWWHRRAVAIKQFDAKYRSQKNAMDVLSDIDWARMPEWEGKEVILFGSAFISRNGQEPNVVASISHNNETSVGIIVSDQAVSSAIHPILEKYREDMLYFRGVLQKGKQAPLSRSNYYLSVKSAGDVFAEIPGLEDLPGVTPSAPVGKVVPTDATETKPIISDTIPEGAVSWKDATKYMNKDVVVTGKIGRTSNIGNITFLNFDQSSKEDLTLVVFKENYSKFSQPAETMYKNHNIKVKGKIIDYKGKPEIVIEEPGQIDILD